MSLEYQEIEKLLLDYKIPFPETRLVNSKKEALKSGKRIGYPLVLKLFSKEGEHKTEKGGVILDIENKKDLIRAWDKLSKLKNDGFLIQKMVLGKELIVGMKRDLQFGPVLLFGLGGIFTEILEDIIIRVAPVNKKDALGMIKEIKGYKIIKGIRGGKESNLNAIADIIVSLSNLVLKEKNIKEVDFNPVIVNEKQALVVDARFLINE